MFHIPLTINNLQQAIQTGTIFDDPKVVPHLVKILQLIKNDNQNTFNDFNLQQLSNIVKQTEVKINNQSHQSRQTINFVTKATVEPKKYDFQIKNFVKQSEKLAIAGISLGQSFNNQIYKQLVKLVQQKSLVSARFWGKILGTQNNYFIIQGYRNPHKQHLNVSKGSQKPGQGVNYYCYFVTNDVYKGNWQQLPQITVQHIRIARKIKKLFTGNLDNPVNSFPYFPGVERHYLKAQLARMTHSLELTPKGIYKVNDDNPKVTQYEQEVKIPDFSELSTLEGWVHKNQMILNLGRCTHFVDPSLPQDQMQAAASQLAQKDPQIQRLRGITQDKLPQPQQGGPQTYWIQKMNGNNQTFPKDEAQNVYAVSSLRNTLWPGWITIGYMGGYSNFYIGNGLKSSQSSWSTWSNQNLQLQGEGQQQFHEPNPKQLPKVEQPQQPQNVQGEEE